MTHPAGRSAGPRVRRACAGEGRLRRTRAVFASMLRPLAAVGAALLLFVGTAMAQEVVLPPPAPALPSGQEVAPLDMTLEVQTDGQLWLVLRYLSPRIARDAGDLGYDAVAPDLDALCDGPGLAAAAASAVAGHPPDQIVVALLDRPLPRGMSDPDATQFIGAYLPGEGGCAWQ
ncbi:MAG: DUF6497 family protein [Pseudomonadota bacterium]